MGPLQLLGACCSNSSEHDGLAKIDQARKSCNHSFCSKRRTIWQGQGLVLNEMSFGVAEDLNLSTSPAKRKRVRLFPLGGLVFFPHTRLPLRIFEPRYKQMTEDALAGNREIVIVLPDRPSGKGEPVPIHLVGTLGVIKNERRLPSGEFLMELEGIQRVRILNEIDTPKLYRQADAEILEDVMEEQFASLRELQRTEILRHLHVILPEKNDTVDQYLTYLARQCRPNVFSDIVSYSAPISIELKQELLEETNVDERLKKLVETAHDQLSGMVPDAPPTFPPEFSAT